MRGTSPLDTQNHEHSLFPTANEPVEAVGSVVTYVPSSSTHQVTRRTRARLGETERSAPSSTSARDGQPATCAPDLLDTTLRTEADSHLDEPEVVHTQPA